MKKFWMVLKRDAERTCKRHETLEEAKAEAERLCIIEHEGFYLLEVIQYVEPDVPPTRWTKL